MEMKTSEKGQALILIVFCLVAILGFAALAIDGGRTYSEKRRAQNAADAAAYAAARAAAEGENWRAAAMSQLQMNDFNDPDLGLNPGNPLDIVVYNPPQDGPFSAGEIDPNDDPNQYFQVKITEAVPQSFSQLVFNGEMNVSVEAVARAQPILAVSHGNAMHATNTSACNAVWFDGGGETHVDGGNVYSNSTAVGNCSSGQQNGSGAVRVTGGDIRVVGSWQTVGGSGTVAPNPLEGHPVSGPSDGVTHMALADVPTPNCSGLPARDTSSHDLQPGVYDGIAIHNGTWTMAPGMYCLTDDFRVNGGDLTGEQVLIVMQSGSVDMSGNADIRLIRASSIEDSDGNQFGGMLFFMPTNNPGGIDLGGNAGTIFAGTIYAPGPRNSSKNKCTFGGNSGTIGIKSNIVCDTIEIHGNANVEIFYKEEQNYRLPPMIELSE